MRTLIQTILAMAFILPLSAAQLYDEVLPYEEKPLCSFEGELGGWAGEDGVVVAAALEHATAGKVSLKTHFEKAETRAAAKGAFDFSGWNKLKIDVFNNGEPVTATTTFRDAKNQEYKVWYQYLARGANTLEFSIRGMASAIPEKGQTTPLDVAHIAYIGLALEGPKFPDLFLDNVRLSRGPEPTSVAVVAAPVKTAVEVSADNIIANPDFELGLLQWNTWGRWDGGQYRFGCVGGNVARTGAHAAEISCDKKGRGGIFAKLPIWAPGPFKLTFWARGEGGAELQYGLEPAISKKIGVVADAWTKYEEAAPLDPGTTLYIYNTGTGNLQIDSVSLVRTEPDPMVKAPEFEPDRPNKVTVVIDRTFVNDKPFFPIGFYGVRDPSELVDTGINFVINEDMSDISQPYFDMCYMSGMLTVANFTGLMRGHAPDHIVEVANKVRKNPSLFGYYLCDEPDHALWSVPAAELRHASNLLRKSDPDHPTITLTMAWERSPHYQYGDVCDIQSSNPYCADDDMDFPVRAVKRTIDASPDKRPVWVVLNAGSSGTPAPTATALSGQCYAALASGADGIFWHSYAFVRMDNILMDAVKQVAGELRFISEELCGDEPDISQPTFSDKRIIGIVKQTPATMLLIAVNTTVEDVGQVTITSPGFAAHKAEVLFESRAVEFANDAITDTFLPGQRHLYQFRP
jgi:hypothetical protein